MKARKWFVGLAVVPAIVIVLVLATGLTWAQEPGPPDGGDAAGEDVDGAAAAVSSVVPIQGQLTDDSGNPLDGTYSIKATLYDASTNGNALCTDTDSVTVDNGLFVMYLDGASGCSSSDISGQRLYLGIEVESDGEMTPRRGIYPVPYAWSLRPGALISDTRDTILTVRSTGSGDSDAFIADASGTGEAIEAYATDGVGVFAKSDTYVALQAYSYETDDHPAVFGCSASSSGSCDPFRDDAAAGVFGYGSPGVQGQGSWGNGVMGRAGLFGAGVKGEGTALGWAGWFTNTDQTVLYITSGNEDSDNAIYVDGGLDSEADFRVTNAGAAYADQGWQGSADFAELIEAEDGVSYEPGDVLIISAASDRAVDLSTDPYSTLVAGVYSTKPGFIGSSHPMEERRPDEVPLAVVGIAPCKVSAENGPIGRGDLLVTSSTPGHAMRAGDDPPQGTILGKALGELKEGVGVIEILVTLQ
jgi:hypothetical protein